MKHFIKLICLLLLSTQCFGQAKPASKPASKKVDHYKTAKFEVAIFPADSAAVIEEGERFTPDRKEVDKAEKALTMQLKELNKKKQGQKKSDIIHEHLDMYGRQYFGYIDPKTKHKVLLINSFVFGNDPTIDRQFLKEFIMSPEGGSAYWRVSYDIDADKLFSFKINDDNDD